MRLKGSPLVKLIALVMVCQCMVTCVWGQITIGKVITERRLTWEDFEGTADLASPFSAMTNWTVGYRAHVDSSHRDTFFLSFRVTPTFNSFTSWVKKKSIEKKKESEALLRHEQGHYDLAIICAETLKQALQASIFFKADYGVKADSITDATVRLFTQIEDQYDLETNHKLNTNEQKRWNENIGKLLNQVPNVYHNR